MKFNKEDLVELTDCSEGKGFGDFTLMEVVLVDTSRWSIIYEMVFKYKDNYYRSSYSRGATECQDEPPYEYAPEEVECPEVIPVETTVTKWVKK